MEIKSSFSIWCKVQQNINGRKPSRFHSYNSKKWVALDDILKFLKEVGDPIELELRLEQKTEKVNKNE